MFAKTLRMRQGGGTSSADDDEDDDAPSLGNANNLVSTDIDTITSSLETSLQLLAIPFKLIVALIYLYVLLGWSAFVALAVIVLFTPLSGWVSSRYGAVQGTVRSSSLAMLTVQIMKRADQRISVFSEVASAIRTVKVRRAS